MVRFSDLALLGPLGLGQVQGQDSRRLTFTAVNRKTCGRSGGVVFEVLTCVADYHSKTLNIGGVISE
jgi:hypothetical protein